MRKGMIANAIAALGLAALACSCTADVSLEEPHRKIVGTVWRLKQDGYLVKEWLEPVTFEPCYWLQPYDERRIGEKEGRARKVGGLRKGTLVRIDRVVKEPGLLATDCYLPMGVPLDASGKATGGEVSFAVIYGIAMRKSAEQRRMGVLDGNGAERVK
jgi:hypothetical protein